MHNVVVCLLYFTHNVAWQQNTNMLCMVAPLQGIRPMCRTHHLTKLIYEPSWKSQQMFTFNVFSCLISQAGSA